MRFWDSSALVPLMVDESTSVSVLGEYEDDPEVVVWWSASIECVSALARRERDGELSSASMARGMMRLDAVAAAWLEILPTASVRRNAIRLLRVHSLSATDALQLAAAIIAAEEHPATLPFTTLDTRLAIAAEREGFHIVSPGARL